MKINLQIFVSLFLGGGGVIHSCTTNCIYWNLFLQDIPSLFLLMRSPCFTYIGTGSVSGFGVFSNWGGWPTFWTSVFQSLISRFRVELNSAIFELVFGKEYRLVFIICIKNNKKFQQKIQTYTDSKTKSTLCISTQLKIDNTVFAVVLKPLPIILLSSGYLTTIRVWELVFL